MGPDVTIVAQHAAFVAAAENDRDYVIVPINPDGIIVHLLKAGTEPTYALFMGMDPNRHPYIAIIA
jgi:hypothetical protein